MYDLQKANMWKRISAFVLDVIIMTIVAVGFAFLLSLILGYDSYSVRLEESYAKYEEEFGVVFDITGEEYEKMTEAELDNFNHAMEAVGRDADVIALTQMLISLTVLITVFGILVAMVILEFVIPLIFGNGQTIGKKIFGVGVMRIDGVKITGPVLFIRSILGKYTVETMIPALLIIMMFFGVVGIMGLIVIAVILISQIVMMIATRTNSTIHDMISNTVTVDLMSQMIFESQEKMIEYKKNLHAERAAEADY